VASFDILTNLRRQHEDLIELSEELLSELQTDSPVRYTSLLHTLSLFEGKLKIHLSMEDKHLYPQLITHEDVDVRNLTKKYVREMSGIYDTFNSFVQRWKSDAPPEGFPALFTEEMKGIVEVVHARISSEEGTLFPLLEKSGSDRTDSE